MATRDFRSQQIRTTQLVASGTDSTKPSMLLYSASAATNDQGGYQSDMLTAAGSDTWMFVSGSTDPADNEQVLFGGNVVLSGTLSGSGFASLPAGDLTFDSGDDIIFNSAGTEFFQIKNDTQDEVVVNDGSNDIDFRVESDGMQSAIHVDAENDMVIIGRSDAPADLGPGSTPAVGTDVRVLIDGTADSKDGGARGSTLVAGDLVVSGTLYAEKQVMEVDLSQTGQLVMSGGIHFKDLGAAAGSSGQTGIVVEQNDGAIFVSTGSLFLRTQPTLGSFKENKIGQGYSAGNGLKESTVGSTTTFSTDDAIVAHLTGSQFSGNVGVTGSLGVSGDLSIEQDNKFYLNGSGSSVFIRSDHPNRLQIDGDETLSLAGDASISLTSNLNIFKVTPDVVEINDGMVDVDFEVNSDTYRATLLVDAGDDSIILGHEGFDATPAASQADGYGDDIKIMLSGSAGSKDSATRGVVSVPGDMVVSGTLYYADDSSSESYLSSPGNGLSRDINSNTRTIELSLIGISGSEGVGNLQTTDSIAFVDSDQGFSTKLTTFAAVSSLVAGNGLDTSGGQLIVDADGGTLTVAATGVKVSDGGITETQVATSVAGDGLAGGGGSALSVNAGAGLKISSGNVVTDDAVVAHLTGSQFSGVVGITGSLGVTADLTVGGTLFDGSGNRLIPLGYNENGTFSNAPNATGTNAVAIGNNAVASGNHSIALGTSTTNTTDATGEHAVAIGGDDATASGDYSAAIGGYANTASGNYSVVLGRNSAVSGQDSVAIGKSLTVPEANSIVFGNSTSDAKIVLSGTLESKALADFAVDAAVSGSLFVSEYIRHIGNEDTAVHFLNDKIRLQVGTKKAVKVNTDSVLILSGGHETSVDQTAGLDVAFFVSGSTGSRGTTTKGTSLFGGDVHISGALSGPSEYALTDSTVRVFRDGSTLKFVDGVTSAKTLEDLTQVTATNAFILGVDGDSSTRSKLKTTASIAFSGDEDAYVDGMAADGVGSDVFFFVSGSLGAKGLAQRHTALFAGDVVFSGSIHGADVTGSYVKSTGDLVAGGNVIRNSNSDKNIVFDSSNPFNLFAASAAVDGATPQTLVHVEKKSPTQAQTSNVLSDFNILLRNYSDQTKAFSGIAFDISEETDADSIGAAIRAERDASAGTDITDHSTNLTLATNTGGDSGLTTRMVIDHTGSVGIGTETPSTTLHIAANDSMVIPVGTTAQRGTNKQGGIRFNTDNSVFEGYDGSTWSSLGGVRDVDQDTYVRAETNPGTDNDDLVFVTDGLQRASIDDTGAFAITGTLDVSSYLDVTGDITGSAIRSSTGEFSAADARDMKLQAPQDVQIYLDVDNNGGHHFEIYNGAGTEILSLDESGNLQIDGDLTVSNNRIFDSGNNNVLSFDGSGTVNNQVQFTGNGHPSSNPGDIKLSSGLSSIDQITTGLFFTSTGRTLVQRSVGVDFLTLLNPSSGQNELVVNESGQDHDFRVETNTGTHTIFARGSDNNVGIRNSNPSYPLDVTGDIQLSGDLRLGGNTIRASDGGATITLDTSDNVTVAGDLTTNGYLQTDLGIPRPTSVLVNTSVSSLDDYFLKIAQTISAPDNIDTTFASFLVVFTGYETSTARDGDFAYIVNVKFTARSTSPYYYTDGTYITVEPLHAGNLEGFDPTTDVQITFDNTALPTVVELWIKAKEQYKHCFVSHLGGSNSVDSTYADPGFEILTGQTPAASVTSLGQDIFGTFVSKRFDSVTAASAELPGSVLGITVSNPSSSQAYSITTTENFIEGASTGKARVTFVAPQSGNVEINFQCMLHTDGDTAGSVYLGLGTNGTTFGSGDILGTQNTVYTADSFEQEQKNIINHSWIVTGLTAGTSYTYYIGADATVGSTFVFRWGDNNSDLFYPPLVVKAIALGSTITDM